MYNVMYNVMYVHAFEPFCLHNEGVRYQFDASPLLLTPDYDGNYIPSNRRDWWVTLVAVVYSHVVSLRAARTRKGNLSNGEFMNPSERVRPVTHVRQKRGTE